jgi:hypothetical protein
MNVQSQGFEMMGATTNYHRDLPDDMIPHIGINFHPQRKLSVVNDFQGF